MQVCERNIDDIENVEEDDEDDEVDESDDIEATFDELKPSLKKVQRAVTESIP